MWIPAEARLHLATSAYSKLGQALTGAIFQCRMGAPSQKPTRLLYNIPTLHTHTWPGLPQFDDQFKYIGPLQVTSFRHYLLAALKGANNLKGANDLTAGYLLAALKGALNNRVFLKVKFRVTKKGKKDWRERPESRIKHQAPKRRREGGFRPRQRRLRGLLCRCGTKEKLGRRWI